MSYTPEEFYDYTVGVLTEIKEVLSSQMTALSGLHITYVYNCVKRDDDLTQGIWQIRSEPVVGHTPRHGLMAVHGGNLTPVAEVSGVSIDDAVIEWIEDVTVESGEYDEYVEPHEAGASVLQHARELLAEHAE